jgi:hypothetical protein
MSVAWNENAAFFLALQTGVPPVAFGEPGVAKTRMTEAFARAMGRHYESICGGQHEPADLTGYPHISEAHGKKCLSFAKTEWRINLENSPNGGILHLDELTDCPPAVQAAMLQLLTHGVENTWICATGNPAEVSTNGYDLAPTTVNRLCCLVWKTPVKSWERGMMNDFKSSAQQFPILPANWREHIAQCRAMIVSYTTKTHPDHLQSLPKDTAKRAQPWPSLRSWTNAATLLAACVSLNTGAEIETELVQGCVGEGCALAFLKWRKSLDLPDPEELLASPKKYKPSARGDVAHVVLSSVIAAVAKNNTPDRWNSAWEILGIQCDTAPDIAATVAAPLAQNKPNANIPTPEHVRKKLLPILQALT